MKKIKFIQLCGLPASGKTTYLKDHYKSYVKVSLDDIRRIFFGHQFHQNAEGYVVANAKNMVRILLEQGHSVVLDSTALLFQFRREWKNLAESYGAEYSVVYFETPLSECLRRNKLREKNKRVPKDVLVRMSVQLEIPDTFVNVPECCPVKTIWSE